MAYPSVVSTISNPNPTDKLNSPSHSGIETAQNAGIIEIQNFVGTQASAVGTLIYDIRSTNSNGGGHIQTANKGGTGQTSFSKGDLLVAQSSSVISKLAVGNNGQFLTADSGQATGVKWSSPGSSITFSTTEVYNALAPDTYTDLDLSSVVGANPALVLLKVTNNGVSDRAYRFRVNGDTIDQPATSSAYFGTSSCFVKGNGNFSEWVLVKTDANGIVEWDSEATTMSTSVTVQAYWI